ncbi:hypothetical protein NBRC110019_13440 [Neptunitalea chrysea]|uniref:Lipocalin-like domain-containing protein n=1 Tax=Neptunitalea chrysea TaxID=1647581 RepID=A0A9W6B649_9FLAO|nr:hypothetical protein [Neptunitalea chrysea]GLB52305.1 hypothetical protein NBRC110019_13440 [Neptunitalea chrysea]
MKFVKILFFITLSFSILGCSKQITEIDLSNLNGYWEIDKVVTSDGATKQYQVNTTVDYLELKDSLSGFRKKMYPTLNGTYKTNSDAEFFTIIKENKDYYFDYKTSMDEWKEKLLKVDKDHFSISNDSGNTYYYKRFEPINIE